MAFRVHGLKRFRFHGREGSGFRVQGFRLVQEPDPIRAGKVPCLSQGAIGTRMRNADHGRVVVFAAQDRRECELFGLEWSSLLRAGLRCLG